MEMILYFHGYASNGNSSTANIIRSAYPNKKVICPTYNTSNADIAIQELDKVVNELLHQDSELILVGSSLGGFFANYFSNKYSLPVVLINPSLDPSNSLKKYQSNNTDTFLKYYTEDVNGVSKIVVLGKKDFVVPYTTFMNRFESRYKIFINEDMEHRVKHKNEIVPAINEIINRLAS